MNLHVLFLHPKKNPNSMEWKVSLPTQLCHQWVYISLFSPMIHELFLDHIMPQATCIVKFWSWHYFSIINIVLLWPYVRYNLTRCSTFPIYFIYRLHLLMYFVYNAILPMSSYILTKMFLAVVFPSIKAKEIKYSPKKGSTLYNYGSQR